ncbi:hypothetical protein I568_01660 [Enterococcus columbae DSM 7374 = ATCC 51263]|uniref:Uncharacterized protein n=1 Tax=Enterococcus columbae DSM 7374 = ATCC 51263 TaxID=1121865 RepID=S0KRT0_9ENTE|nr:hypothetical protein OMW_01040 [Enterococcus columbae DSM 7374 = ATCC 51263]EOW80483.1 hypothetical protein I568_01660 [Enterococcus columbae DSM 7374 = ATCC 51263]
MNLAIFLFAKQKGCEKADLDRRKFECYTPFEK